MDDIKLKKDIAAMFEKFRDAIPDETNLVVIYKAALMLVSDCLIQAEFDISKSDKQRAFLRDLVNMVKYMKTL